MADLIHTNNVMRAFYIAAAIAGSVHFAEVYRTSANLDDAVERLMDPEKDKVRKAIFRGVERHKPEAPRIVYQGQDYLL